MAVPPPNSPLPGAIMVGLYKSATGVSQLNPEPSTVVQPGDELIMLRPGPAGTDACPPLKEAPQVDAGERVWQLPRALLGAVV